MAIENSNTTHNGHSTNNKNEQMQTQMRIDTMINVRIIIENVGLATVSIRIYCLDIWTRNNS